MDLQKIFADGQKVSDLGAAPNLIREVPLQFEMPKALRALRLITKKYPLHPGCRQLSLTHAEADPAKQNVNDGAGSLFDYEKNSWKAREADFPFFSAEFQHTYFHEIYLRSQEWTGGRIGRVRIMFLPPRSCYSMHRDPTIRLHLALVTNPQAFLVFREGQLVHVPADGRLYALDTRREHTAMNCSLEDRIHLVLSLREL